MPKDLTFRLLKPVSQLDTDVSEQGTAKFEDVWNFASGIWTFHFLDWGTNLWTELGFKVGIPNLKSDPVLTSLLSKCMEVGIFDFAIITNWGGPYARRGIPQLSGLFYPYDFQIIIDFLFTLTNDSEQVSFDLPYNQWK